MTLGGCCLKKKYYDLKSLNSKFEDITLFTICLKPLTVNALSEFINMEKSVILMVYNNYM